MFPAVVQLKTTFLSNRKNRQSLEQVSRDCPLKFIGISLFFCNNMVLLCEVRRNLFSNDDFSLLSTCYEKIEGSRAGLTDPGEDPGGPKAYGSYASGSGPIVSY